MKFSSLSDSESDDDCSVSSSLVNFFSNGDGVEDSDLIILINIVIFRYLGIPAIEP